MLGAAPLAGGRAGQFARRPRTSARAEYLPPSWGRGQGVHLDLSPRETKQALRHTLLAQRPAVMATQPASAPLAVRDQYLAAFAPPPGTVCRLFSIACAAS